MKTIFKEWWEETGQFLNEEIRQEMSVQEFWARKGWDAAIWELKRSVSILEMAMNNKG
jgi:hypothetical protein